MAGVRAVSNEAWLFYKGNKLRSMLMKKKVIAAAVAATLGHTAANAVSVNPNGLGQVLIYPYYTTQAGTSGNYDTLLTVVNTTNKTKAVKVRFLEAKNSFEVLDFNLYLSPRDVWVGVLSQVASNAAGEVGNAVTLLTTPDTSCTAPAIPAAGVEFRNLQFSSNADGGNAGGGTGLERTLEGYIEIIEMGVVGNDGDFTPDAWSTHVTDGLIGPGGTPLDCQQVVDAWSVAPAGEWTANNSRAISVPSGGLFGSVSLINVNDGTNYSYDATALADFFTIAGDNLHRPPGSIFPNLGDVQPRESIVVEGNSIIDSFWNTGQTQVAAVSAVLMRAFAANDFATDSTVDADSSFVFTMPTKREHLRGDATLLPPFTNFFADGQACETVFYSTWDREEDNVTPRLGIDFSPAPIITPDVNTLCFEANVVDINGTSALGSQLVNTSINDTFENGWIRASFDTDVQHQLTDDAGNVYRGLPVVGFAVQRLFNASVAVAGGTSLSHYGGLFDHKTSTKVMNANGVQIAGHDAEGERVVLSQ